MRRADRWDVGLAALGLGFVLGVLAFTTAHDRLADAHPDRRPDAHMRAELQTPATLHVLEGAETACTALGERLSQMTGVEYSYTPQEGTETTPDR